MSKNKTEFQDEWMIRPCAMYEDEHSECTSIRGRFHQYFIFGKLLDCSQWKVDHGNCKVWDSSKSKEAYEQLITSERERRMKRLKGHYANDVWKKRDKPPEDWNRPLPKWIEENMENTFLETRSKELKENVKSTDVRYCVIL